MDYRKKQRAIELHNRITMKSAMSLNGWSCKACFRFMLPFQRYASNTEDVREQPADKPAKDFRKRHGDLLRPFSSIPGGRYCRSINRAIFSLSITNSEWANRLDMPATAWRWLLSTSVPLCLSVDKEGREVSDEHQWTLPLYIILMISYLRLSVLSSFRLCKLSIA